MKACESLGCTLITLGNFQKALMTLMLGRLKAGEEGTTEDEMVGWHH